MFGAGWTELAVLLVVAVFVFGPEKLPSVAADAARLVRQLRSMAQGMTDDLKSELGPEFADLDIASLHPRALVERALKDDDDPPAPRSATSPIATAAAHQLAPGAIPPFDPDAT